MKTILVALTDVSRLDGMLDTAVRLAETSGGHVIGYYPIPAPALIIVTAPGADVPLDDSYSRLRETQEPKAQQAFEARMRASGVQYEWRTDHRRESSFLKGILAHGREADLILLPYSDVELIADVALGAGRPVMALPQNTKAANFDNIAIGWNASREACRAAFDSLPLLKTAKEVTLLWVNPDKTLGKKGKLPGTELATSLARHDVKITTRGLSNRSKTSKALIDYATENSVDLLVIGAYGHTRLRELILGGVTQDILEALPCPVLLSN